MREIKFRGIDIISGEWVYGYYVKGKDRHCIRKSLAEYPMWDVIPESVSEYTGLKDKNGVEIYEGDNIDGHGERFIVKFGEYKTNLFKKEYGDIETKQFGWYAENIVSGEQCNLVSPNGIEVVREKKLIKNWEQLSKVSPNDKYKIIVEDCCGWIVPVCDEPDDEDNFKCNCGNDNDYFENHVYLSTHTFYGSQYEYSTRVLQEHGFDIEIDNWDK